MIYSIKQFPDKKFTDKMDLTRFIKKNFEDIQKAKLIEYKNNANKAIDINTLEANFTPKIEDITSDIIEVKALVNSTNIIDSHLDLHSFKTWNKSVKDNKSTYVLDQHENNLNTVLSRKGININEQMNFKDFGFKDMEFIANMSKFILNFKDNPKRFEQYAKGEITNHSVGMLYVMGKIELAYYDEESQKNMDFFEKVKSEALNPEIADVNGYVWYVSEAIKREGSPVVFGSNPITPTLEVKNYEPSNDTRKINKNEPPVGTQSEVEKLFNLINL